MRTQRAFRCTMGLLAALAAIALAGLGCRSGQSEGKRQLVLAHVHPDSHPVHRSMVRMGELLERNSGGALTLEIRHSGQLGAERELLEKTQAGGIQMTKVSTSLLESLVPELGVLSLPYLFHDDEHYWAVLDGPVGRDMLDRLEAVGLKGLTYYDAGARSFYAREPITGLQSLQGRQIRVQQSPTMIRTMEALGITPVALAFGPELTQALEKGERVDGAENNLPSYWTEQHYLSCPHYYADRHSRPPDVLVMSLKAWNALSAQEQAALTDAVRQSAVYQRQLWQEEVARILRELDGLGVTVAPDVEREPFIQAVQPVYDGLPAEHKAWVDRVRAARPAATQPATAEAP